MILADAHVHIYSGYPLDDLLDAAWRNFRSFQPQRSEDLLTPFLLLTEARGYRCFHSLRAAANDASDRAAPPLSRRWRLRPTAESVSVLAEGVEEDRARIVVAAGRQIVTRERLEVLSLLSDQGIPDGMALADTVDAVHEAGGIPVAPWGVGKWIGGRGRLLRHFLPRARMPFWLGDNGGRPTFWPTPPIFRAAADLGIGILPGSDPLPLRAELHRIGSYGFGLPESVDPDRPAGGLRGSIERCRKMLLPFGRRQRTLSFAIRQLQLRLAGR